MPPARWTQINGVVWADPRAEAAKRKQDRGDPLSDDDRQALEDANMIMESEIRWWQGGHGFNDPRPSLDGSPEPGGTPGPTGTPTPADLGATPAGTPTPTGTPEPTATPTVPPTPTSPPTHPISGLPLVPSLEPPPPFTANPAPGDLDVPSAARSAVSPDDQLTVTDDWGNTLQMTRGQYDAQDPSYQGTLRIVNVEPAGTRDLTVPPLPRAAEPPPVAAAAAAPAAPVVPPAAPAAPATKAPSIKLPPQTPLEAPFQDEAPNRRPPAQTHPTPPIATARPTPKPPAAAPKAAPPPASIAPPLPFERDETGAVLPEGRLTRAIARAGEGRVRPTRPVVERVAREIGDVFRPGDQGGWRGDTGGWRTLAQEAAAAWERQYKEAPNTLDPRERAAYQKDPHSLYTKILDPDSPFRNYRESWIGAVRNGEVVPDSAEFVGELGPYGVAAPRGVPRAAPAAAPPQFEPGSGISNTTDRGGVPREYTPASVTGGGSGVAPGQAPPTGVTNVTDAGGVPREYTPSSQTGPRSTPGEPPTAVEPIPLDVGQGRVEPIPIDLSGSGAVTEEEMIRLRAPEQQRVIPYSGEETPPPDGQIVPEETPPPPVIVLGAPEDVPIEEGEGPVDDSQYIEQPSYAYDEQPSYYDEEPVYDEEQPSYEDVVAESEPVYDEQPSYEDYEVYA